MEDKDIVIRLKGVSKMYKLFGSKADRLKEALHPFKKKYHKPFYALKDIHLEVKRGEILGIVGVNGSGKSTLLKLISGIIPATRGSVEVKGRVVPLLELGAGFNPEFTGLENIYFYNSIHGYTRRQTDAILDEILDFAEIGEFIHQPVKTYSSGMKARLAFAVSVNIDPDILILDEVLSVGDELFRRKCYAKMEQFFAGGKTILFVSHSIQSINELCTNAIFLDRGECILKGSAKLVTMYYQKFLFTKQEDLKKLKEEIAEVESNEKRKRDFLGDLHDLEQTKTESVNTMPLDSNGSEPSIELPGNLSCTDNMFFIPDFVPKTMVKTGNNVDFIEYYLLDSMNRVVNILEFGRTYTFYYKVRFNTGAENVLFGIQLKTNNGLIISGANTKDFAQINIQSVSEGDEFEIAWKFECYLHKGHYYTNLFVDIPGHGNSAKILDSNVFRVINKESINFAGYYAIFRNLHLKNLNNNKVDQWSCN
jgi:lipopolysaccharide transport system ATP-binding protein